MPHTTTWTANGVIWEYSGRVTLTEVAEANTEFYSDSRSDNTRYQIFDASAAEEIIGNESEARMLAAIDSGASRSIPRLKVALVIQKPMQELAETYMENLKKYGSQWECRVFYSQTEAKAWVAAE